MMNTHLKDFEKKLEYILYFLKNKVIMHSPRSKSNVNCLYY